MKSRRNVRSSVFLRPLSFFSLGRLLMPKRSLGLSSAADGRGQSVVEADQRDCKWAANMEPRRSLDTFKFAAARSSPKVGDAKGTFILGGDMVREQRHREELDKGVP